MGGRDKEKRKDRHFVLEQGLASPANFSIAGLLVS
jgi:hypothetical protein